MQKHYLPKIILLALLLTTTAFCQITEGDTITVNKKLIGYDKFQHMAVSCLLTVSSQYILESKTEINKNEALYYSVSSSTAIGLTKELNDMKIRKQSFDWGDIIANFVGIGLAVIVINL